MNTDIICYLSDFIYKHKSTIKLSQIKKNVYASRKYMKLHNVYVNGKNFASVSKFQLSNFKIDNNLIINNKYEFYKNNKILLVEELEQLEQLENIDNIKLINKNYNKLIININNNDIIKKILDLEN